QDAGPLTRYVPFDVSDEFLRDAADTLADEFTDLDMHLVIGDFHHHLGEIPTDGRRVVAFLGGTIGNLDPAQRARFLFDLNCTMSSDDYLLLGTDLVKDELSDAGFVVEEMWGAQDGEFLLTLAHPFC